MLATHAERVAVRRAINGQPNGYRPVTEAELSPRVGYKWQDEDDDGDRDESPHFVDVSTISEYGLDQKLSNSIRCF